MKTVLLDCDGVLADFIGRVCETIVHCGGGEFNREQVTEFDFAKSLNLDPVLARAVKYRISNEPGWWSSLRPFPSAQVGVSRLMAAAEVYIVTSPWNSCRTWLHEREEWLRRHFGIPHARVLAASAKHIVAGDFLIDDKTETLQHWQRARGVGHGRAIQWETPHNRRDEWTGASTRDWSDVVRWVTA